MNKKEEVSDEMKDKFKDRFKKIINKKFDTTMIYPLSQFEAAFGHLWGNGKLEENLTDEELVYLAKWRQCRNNILNQGNLQKRNFGTELAMHDVIWNRYQAVFIPVNKMKEEF